MENYNRQYRLSIITVNMNNAEGLRKTLESIRFQNNKAFEYIVIDGASTDYSVSVIQEFQECIDIWSSEPDSGIYNAMNKGLRKAKGEYCLFLNSGDYLIEDKAIENILNVNTKSDIISFGAKIRKRNSYVIHLPPKEVSLFTFVCGSLPHPSTLIKRKLLIENGGYDENYRIISDWKFFYESLILNNATYDNCDYISTVFDGVAGMSTDYSHTELNNVLRIIQDTIPRQIVSDYFLECRVAHEYFYNVCYYQSKHKSSRWLVLLSLRLINRLLGARNHNLRLNQIYFGRD